MFACILIRAVDLLFLISVDVSFHHFLLLVFFFWTWCKPMPGDFIAVSLLSLSALCFFIVARKINELCRSTSIWSFLSFRHISFGVSNSQAAHRASLASPCWLNCSVKNRILFLFSRPLSLVPLSCGALKWITHDTSIFFLFTWTS